MMVRKEVSWFAKEMEDVLKSKDHLYPDGWKNDKIQDLLDKLDDKFSCLEVKLWDMYQKANRKEDYDEMVRLSIDIANFAMMIADISYKLKLGLKPESESDTHVWW